MNKITAAMKGGRSASVNLYVKIEHTRQDANPDRVKPYPLPTVSFGVGNQQQTDRCNCNAHDGHEPKDPTPASILHQDGADEYTKNIANGAGTTE
jgi:hypothetical protein